MRQLVLRPLSTFFALYNCTCICHMRLDTQRTLSCLFLLAPGTTMATTLTADPWKTVRYVSGTAAATLALLALKYPDRAIFDEHREGIATMKGLPLVGGLPRQILNRDVAYDMLCKALEDLDAVTMYVLLQVIQMRVQSGTI